MKQSILLLTYLFYSVIILAPEERYFDYNKPKSEKVDKPIERNKTEERNNVATKSPYKKNNSAINSEKIDIRLPHEIDPSSNMSKFHSALKDAYKERQKNPNLTRQDSLKNATELFNEAKRNLVKVSDFAQHINDKINQKGLADIYGPGKADDHIQELINDLQTIDPYLYKKVLESISLNKKTDKKTLLSEKNLIAVLEANPFLLTNPEKYSGNIHEKTPLESAIDSEDPALIKEILRIAKESKISSDTLIQPIKDKALELLKNEKYDETEKYFKNIYKLNIPELNLIVAKNIVLPNLEFNIETDNSDDAKIDIKTIKSLNIPESFMINRLANKLIDMERNNNNKKVESYLRVILETDEELFEKINIQINNFNRLKKNLLEDNTANSIKIFKKINDLKISKSFITKQLIEEYKLIEKKNGTESAYKFLTSINNLGDDNLYSDLYEKLFSNE